ncbi:MAG: mRNA surveillance protein pelota, partial [Methanomassiliicoccales archaeon]
QTTGKKEGEGEAQEGFFSEIMKVVKSLPELPIIIVGPGFIKEDFLRYAREREPQRYKGVQLIQTGQGGMSGIREAMSKGENASALEGLRLAEEARLIEELKRCIAEGGPCTYGTGQVRMAIDAGAVDTLIVSDRRLHDPEIQEIMKAAEHVRSKIKVVTSNWDTGRTIDGLGGVAALLRYRV